MAAVPSSFPALNYGRARSRLTLVTDSEPARRLAVRAFAQNDDLAVQHEHLEGLDRLPGGDLIWVELAEAPSDDAVLFLDKLQQRAVRQAAGCVLSVTAEWIDLVAARIVSPDIAVLITPSDIERVAALALAQADQSNGVRENSTDRSEARLRQLSDEVNRIALALARLSDTPLSPDTMRPVQAGEGPPVSPELIRSIIRARRFRDQFVPGNLFADPAWDILLDLLQAEIIQHRVPVSSLCIASAVPATTALRWIRTMTDRGMLLRREDPHDARRVFIELAVSTSTAIRRFFEKVGSPAVV